MSMKKIIFIPFLLLLFSCEKVYFSPQPDVRPQPQPAQITFYLRHYSRGDKPPGNVDIWIDRKGFNCTSCPEYMGQFTYTFMDSTPSPLCSSSVNTIIKSDNTFTAHDYWAKETGYPFRSWGGSFTLKPSECRLVEIIVK